MKQVYKYDSFGNYIEPVIIQDNETLPKNCTDKPLPEPNWKPVYNLLKREWVETISPNELAALTNVEQPKSEIEILKEQTADANLQIIELWETLISAGVI